MAEPMIDAAVAEPTMDFASSSSPSEEEERRKKQKMDEDYYQERMILDSKESQPLLPPPRPQSAEKESEVFSGSVMYDMGRLLAYLELKGISLDEEYEVPDEEELQRVLLAPYVDCLPPSEFEDCDPAEMEKGWALLLSKEYLQAKLDEREERLTPFLWKSQERSINMYEKLLDSRSDNIKSPLQQPQPEEWEERAKEAISKAKDDPNFKMWKHIKYEDLLEFDFDDEYLVSPYYNMRINRHSDDGRLVKVRGLECPNVPRRVSYGRKEDKEYLRFYKALKNYDEAKAENSIALDISDAAEKIAKEEGFSLDENRICYCACDVYEEKISKKLVTERYELLKQYVQAACEEEFVLLSKLRELDMQLLGCEISCSINYENLKSTELQTALEMINEEYRATMSHIWKHPMTYADYLKLKLQIADELEMAGCGGLDDDLQQ